MSCPNKAEPSVVPLGRSVDELEVAWLTVKMGRPVVLSGDSHLPNPFEYRSIVIVVPHLHDAVDVPLGLPAQWG